MDRSIIIRISISILILIILGLFIGLYFFKSRRDVPIFPTTQKESPTILDFVNNNADCEPVVTENIDEQLVDGVRAESIVYQKLIRDESYNPVLHCIYKKDLNNNKDTLLLDQPDQSSGFAFYSRENLFYTKVSADKQSLILQKKNITTGQGQEVFAYQYSPADRAFLIEENEQEYPDTGIVASNLQLIRNYLFVIVSFDYFSSTDDLSGLGYGSAKKIFIFQIDEDGNPHFTKAFYASATFDPTILFIGTSGQVYMEMPVYEGPSDIEVFSFQEDTGYSIGDKLGFRFFGGSVSPTGGYFAFTPLLYDPTKRTGPIENKVALFDFSQGQLITSNVIDKKCDGEFPGGMTCFEIPIWLNDSTFAVKHEDGSAYHFMDIDVKTSSTENKRKISLNSKIVAPIEYEASVQATKENARAQVEDILYEQLEYGNIIAWINKQ